MAPNNMNCCECKLVTKEDFKCEKCKRLYHHACWPNREVKDEKTGEIIGCTICVKSKEKSVSGKKRRLNDMNDVSEMCTEEILKRMIRLLLIENNSILKNFILEITVENTENLQKEIGELKNEISQLKNELNEVKNKNGKYEKGKGSEKLTFSEAVKNKNTMILKAKNSEKAINIEKEVKQKVNVTELQIGINKLKTKKTGTVIIECDNKKSQACLKQQITEKLTNEVSISKPKIINNNNLKIVNINKDMNEKSDEEILTIIKKQNEILNNDKNLKIKKRITFEKRESWSIILEVDCMTHQQLLEQGILKSLTVQM